MKIFVKKAFIVEFGVKIGKSARKLKVIGVSSYSVNVFNRLDMFQFKSVYMMAYK